MTKHNALIVEELNGLPVERKGSLILQDKRGLTLLEDLIRYGYKAEVLISSNGKEGRYENKRVFIIGNEYFLYVRNYSFKSFFWRELSKMKRSQIKKIEFK